MAYSPKNKEQVLKEILYNISDKYDKSVGYLPYDLSSANSIEISGLYDGLTQLVDSVDVDKMSGDILTKYVNQRKGIIRKPSNKANGYIEVVVSSDTAIPKGSLIETDTGVQFQTTIDKLVSGSGLIPIEAFIAGASGNVSIGTIKNIPVTIQNVISITNTSATNGGYDEENDNSLRERYYEAIRIPATSGNKYHYIKWAKECVGVGDARCIPLWNGDNTVKVIIIDENKQPTSTQLIDIVQNYIDPKGENNSTWGTGLGQAPIGAYTTVVSSLGLAINVSCTVELLPNYTLENVINTIKVNISKYLSDIAFEQEYISYAKIGTIIFESDGIKDFTNLKLNNGTNNIAVANEQVAILGVVSIV